MSRLLWVALTVVAALWPGRLAGSLDGAPLDRPVEAVAIGVLLAWLLATNAWVLRTSSVRLFVVALLAWKAVTAATLAQDGWCLQFTTPAPIFQDEVTVPHSWDVRADWRAPVPRCSAVMTGGYPAIERFPVWFYNLPPVAVEHQAVPSDRPPFVTLKLRLDGHLSNREPGVFQVVTSDDVTARLTVDGREEPAATASSGVTLAPGDHQIWLDGDLSGSQWTLIPLWNGRSPWRDAVSTLTPSGRLDQWVRPWGRAVSPLLVLGLLITSGLTIARRAGSAVALLCAAGLSLVIAGLAWTDREMPQRLFPLLFLTVAAIPLPRRLQNLFGLSLLISLPFLAMYVVLGLQRIGVATWYSSGDDWWMFQRFAYRIFLQGHWIEGGQPTFWFQPFYRWIAGGLHMTFGDSSAGEFFWDAGCMLAGAAFAFHVARGFAGFRWGVVAATLTLGVFTMGPAWYLFGRGLSEISSMGLLAAAALLALRGRHGAWPAIVLSGVLAVLAFYTRLNNLPMAVAVAAFALPLRQESAGWVRPSMWRSRLSRPVAFGVLGLMAAGLGLFALRTWYFTGVFSLLYGTQAWHNAVLQPGDTLWSGAGRLASSLMMLLTMSDPPRFDLRAIPILVGMASAAAAVAGVRGVRRLPLNVVLFSLAGVAGAFVSRGNAYPGRFSVHLIPPTVALSVCAASLLLGRQTRRLEA